MENNEPLPPLPPPPPPPASLPQPQAVIQHTRLLIYDYDPPYNPNPSLYLITSFPLTITLYNFNINNTHLQFTFTNNSITNTPFNIADDDDDDNNGAEGDDNNGEEGIDLLNDDNNEGDNNNNNEEGDNNNNNEEGENHDLVPNGIVADNHAGLTILASPDMDGLRKYGIRLPTLPTLPSYINIANHNLVLLINSGPSVHLIKPALPLPINPIDDPRNNNNEAISNSITMPFKIIFPFNDPNTNTVIYIIIQITVNYIDVRASTKNGVTNFVAYFVMRAPQP